jgi:hypothetical protein
MASQTVTVMTPMRKTSLAAGGWELMLFQSRNRFVSACCTGTLISSCPFSSLITMLSGTTALTRVSQYFARSSQSKFTSSIEARKIGTFLVEQHVVSVSNMEIVAGH